MIIRLVQSLAAIACALATGTSLAAPLPDPAPTITIQLENDSTVPGSDRYYTSGMRVGYTSPTDQVPNFLADLGHTLLGAGQQRYAADLSQYIFTPSSTDLTNPAPNDRPYAAILMASLSLIQDTDDSRTALALGVGWIGPPALGRQTQDWAHAVLGQREARGWDTQIPTQPVVQLTAERTWRVPAAELGGVEVDLLPSVTAGAGTFRIYGQGGMQIRLGQGLDSDFGAPRLRPGLTGTDAYRATRPFAWYVFLGADGQAVAWDETLDGLPFGASRHVTRIPFVGEVQGGLVLMAWGLRFTAAHVVRSREFEGQHGGVFHFSTFSVSAKF